ncbi:unnamed protein product [Rhizophagus irregularis]|nr:unnamed protein product [Rhizophagus irregularis]
MEGIASTAVSKDSTETSFRFEDNEDGFEIVKSKNKKREELKIKKEKLQQTYETNRPKTLMVQLVRLERKKPRTALP